MALLLPQFFSLSTTIEQLTYWPTLYSVSRFRLVTDSSLCRSSNCFVATASLICYLLPSRCALWSRSSFGWWSPDWVNNGGRRREGDVVFRSSSRRRCHRLSAPTARICRQFLRRYPERSRPHDQCACGRAGGCQPVLCRLLWHRSASRLLAALSTGKQSKVKYAE